MKPLISVLMPAYNAERFIADAIESILNQTYKNFELIVADDASTDSTAKIVKEYCAKDKRVALISNKKNLYIAANRNKLIKMARGEFIAWADADDISLPYRLEEQYKIMMKDKKIGICGGSLEIFGNTRANGQVRRYPATNKLAKKKIFRYVTVAQPAAMLRSEVFETIGVFDTKTPPAEDLNLLFRIGEKYKFANSKKILIKYRDNPGSATYKRLKKIEITTIKMRIAYFRNKNYNANAGDYFYNIFHFFSIWLIPPKYKIALFNKLRNSK